MKKSLFSLCLFSSLFSYSIKADDPVDGIIGFTYSYMRHFSDVEKGNRYPLKLEFTRLSRNFGIDVRRGTGLGLTDYGGFLRIFEHFPFSDASATGITAGLGGGVMWAELDSGGTQDRSNSLNDIVVAPFVRFLYQLPRSMALGLDLEYQNVPLRTFRIGPPKQDTTKRHRLAIGLSLLADFGV